MPEVLLEAESLLLDNSLAIATNNQCKPSTEYTIIKSINNLNIIIIIIDHHDTIALNHMQVTEYMLQQLLANAQWEPETYIIITKGYDIQAVQI